MAQKNIRTIKDMLAAGKYDLVNRDVEDILVHPARFTTEGLKVHHFGRLIKTDEIQAAMQSEGREPAPIESLLAYGAENPEEQRKYPIVGLGSSWMDLNGCCYVPFLYAFESGRYVGLARNDPTSQCDEIYRFLSVRKSSA